MKGRILYLDIIRVLACFMVICRHAPMPWGGEGEVPVLTRALMVYSSYLTMPCVCLFFAVSGALLLPAKIEPSESIQWLKKRLKKVVWPTFIWTFFYIILGWIKEPEKSPGGVIYQIMSIPFCNQGHGILWFMYTLVGLYLVTPVISPWLQKCGKRTLELYLGLWGISLCYPFLKAFVEINETPYGILYYFSGFIGYFVLGYYLNTFGLKGKTLWYIVALVFLFPLMFFYKIFIEGRYAFGEELFGYLGLICVLMLVCWWQICGAIANRIKNEKIISSITMVSNLSFGIYFIHIAIMRFFLWRLDYIACIENYILQWSVIVVLTFALSGITAFIISLLPFGNYLIGYKKNKYDT